MCFRCSVWFLSNLHVSSKSQKKRDSEARSIPSIIRSYSFPVSFTSSRNIEHSWGFFCEEPLAFPKTTAKSLPKIARSPGDRENRLAMGDDSASLESLPFRVLRIRSFVSLHEFWPCHDFRVISQFLVRLPVWQVGLLSRIVKKMWISSYCLHILWVIHFDLEDHVTLRGSIGSDGGWKKGMSWRLWSVTSSLSCRKSSRFDYHLRCLLKSIGF